MLYVFHYSLDQNLKGNGGLLQAAGGKDVESGSVAESTPSHNVNDGEASGVVSVGDERNLLSKAVTSLEVGLTVLHGETSLGQGLAVIGEDDEAAKSQSSDSGTTDNEVGVGKSLGNHAGTSHRLRSPLDLRSNFHGSCRESQDFEW